MSAVEIDRNNLLVAGERVGDLTPILLKLHDRFVVESDGRVTFHLCLARREGAILTRALMRIEAELIAAEADRLTVASLNDPVDSDVRRAGAFVELVRRWAQAGR